MFSQKAFKSNFVLSLALCSGKGDCLLPVMKQSDPVILRASARETERCVYFCVEHAPVTGFLPSQLLHQLDLNFGLQVHI